MNPRVLLASGVVVVGVLLPSAAFAQAADDPYVKPPPSEVKGELITRQDEAPPTAEVAGVQATRTAPASQSRSSLPVTGSDLVGLTVIGLAAVAGGTIIVRKSRPTASTVS